MKTAKQQAVALINALPDDVSIEEIHYRLYVLERMREGLAELDAGLGAPDAEAMERFAKWRDG